MITIIILPSRSDIFLCELAHRRTKHSLIFRLFKVHIDYLMHVIGYAMLGAVD